MVLRERRPGRTLSIQASIWLLDNPSWAEAALSRAQHWTFIFAPRGQPETGQKRGEGQKGVKGWAVAHLSLWGARDCFWCQALLQGCPALLQGCLALLQGCPSAVPKPAKVSHKDQGGQWEQPGHSGVKMGGYKGLSHQLRIQLLQGITENLRVQVSG